MASSKCGEVCRYLTVHTNEMESRGIVQPGSVIRNFTDRKFWATAEMQSILSPPMPYCRGETHHRGKIAPQ